MAHEHKVTVNIVATPGEVHTEEMKEKLEKVKSVAEYALGILREKLFPASKVSEWTLSTQNSEAYMDKMLWARNALKLTLDGGFVLGRLRLCPTLDQLVKFEGENYVLLKELGRDCYRNGHLVNTDRTLTLARGYQEDGVERGILRFDQGEEFIAFIAIKNSSYAPHSSGPDAAPAEGSPSLGVLQPGLEAKKRYFLHRKIVQANA